MLLCLGKVFANLSDLIEMVPQEFPMLWNVKSIHWLLSVVEFVVSEAVMNCECQERATELCI